MNWGHNITFSSHFLKQDQVWMRGTIKYRSSWLFGYPQETTSILHKDILLFGLQDQTFLSSCFPEASYWLDYSQDQANGQKAGKKVAELLPSTWGTNLLASHEPRSINLGLRGLICHSTKRRARRRRSHTGLTNHKLLQCSSVPPPDKSSLNNHKQVSCFTEEH